MNKKSIGMIVFGSLLAGVGLLWFLQGSDIVHIQPILCVANCEPITGHSPLWQIVGAAVFIAGVMVIARNARRTKQQNKQ